MALSHSNGEFIKKLDFFAIGKKNLQEERIGDQKARWCPKLLTWPFQRTQCCLMSKKLFVRKRLVRMWTAHLHTPPSPYQTPHVTPPPPQTHTNTKEWNVLMSKANVNWNNSTYILVNVCYLQEYKINLLISFLKVASKLKKIDWL